MLVCEQKRISLTALIDTGAQGCCITNEKAVELGLPVIGKVQLRGSAGETRANRYKVDSIILPGSVVYENEEGLVGYAKCGDAADIILGMDLIGSGLLLLSPDGRMTFAL